MNSKQSAIMEKDDLLQLQHETLSRCSRDELFEKIKNDSRLKAKGSLRLGWFFLTFGLVLSVLFWLSGHDRTSDVVIPFILVMRGLIGLCEYRKNRKMGSFDLPEELLSWKSRQNKKDRRRSMLITVLWLILIACLVYTLAVETDHSNIGFVSMASFALAIIGLTLIVVNLGYFRAGAEQDKEIERLHKLIYQD